MNSAAEWMGIVVSFSVGVIGIVLAVRAQNHAKRIDSRSIERHEVQWSVEFDRRSYTVRATNLGPDDASEVRLTADVNKRHKDQALSTVAATDRIEVQFFELEGDKVRHDADADNTDRSGDLVFIDTGLAVDVAARVTWCTPMGTPREYLWLGEHLNI